MNKLAAIIIWTPVFLALPTGAVAQEAREVIIKVNGMFCPFCTFGVEKRLKHLEEAASVRTALAAGEAAVMLKPGFEFVESHFEDAIKRAGFSQSGILVRTVDAAEMARRATSVGAAPKHEVTNAPGDAGFAFVRSIGGPGDGPGEFNQPMSIAFSGEGWFVVTDSGNARVQQFHADGAPWRMWGVAGDGATPLENPVGIAVGAEGDIWVSDYDADTVSHYGADGAPLGILGALAGRASGLDAPSGVAAGAGGDIAVADFYHHRIVVYDSSGLVLREAGKQGWLRRFAKAGLNYPTRVTLGAGGTIWVADAYNYRVVAFDAEGKVIARLGKKGSDPGEFQVSAGIALLPGGRVAVADFMNHRIQVWTEGGKFLGDYGTQGAGGGQFERPTDVARGPGGQVYVVDWGNHRIVVLAWEGVDG